MNRAVESVERKIAQEPKSLEIQDMPAAVLDGWLGDVCQQRLGDLPLAYAWPALLTVAGAMIPKCAEPNNLFTALVGPVSTGKSTAMERARDVLGIAKPTLVEMYSGSAEGMMKSLVGANGHSRLVYADEFGHLLVKAQIQNASFPYILNSAYCKTKFESTMARGERASFDCRLFLMGGVVQDQFGDLFGTSSLGGFYDRFTFGLCPSGFEYDWRPLVGGPGTLPPLKPVRTQEDVYEAVVSWKKEHPDLKGGRVVENALRAARICVSMNGRELLTANDLGPAFALAQYQASLRKFLKPTCGDTMEAKFANRLIEWLDTRHPAQCAEPGEWVARREAFRFTNVNRVGSVADRAVKYLELNGEIELSNTSAKKIIRRLP